MESCNNSRSNPCMQVSHPEGCVMLQQIFALMENLKMFSRSNLSYRTKREEARWASSTCLSLKKVQTDWL